MARNRSPAAPVQALPTIRESSNGSMAGDSMRRVSSNQSHHASWAGGVMRPTGTPPLGTRRSLMSLPASLADDDNMLGPVIELPAGALPLACAARVP